jgi:hypothetical protein
MDHQQGLMIQRRVFALSRLQERPALAPAVGFSRAAS